MDRDRIDRETALRSMATMRNAGLEFWLGAMTIGLTVWGAFLADMARGTAPPKVKK
jgi:hypothetical protein